MPKVFCRIVLKNPPKNGRHRVLYATLNDPSDVIDKGDTLFFPSVKGDQLEVPKENLDHVEYWPAKDGYKHNKRDMASRNKNQDDETITINQKESL